ncbi:MAG: OmpH family outer membrane protein [Acidobacteria bacterium]|nr:OmpH family outer membrane protein [Acidobacteriota bacterium]
MNRLSRIIIGMVVATLPVTVFAQGAATQPTAAPAKPAGTLNLPVGRFAVINTSAFTGQNGIEQLKQQINRVNDMFKDRNAELEAMRQRAEALQREIQTQGPNLTPAVLSAKQEELGELQVDLTRKKEDLEREYNKAIRDATDPVVERINAFLDNYAKQNNITLVLEAAVLYQARGLAYVDPGLDITNPFIEAYNAANPVKPAGSNQSGANR